MIILIRYYLQSMKFYIEPQDIQQLVILLV